MDWSANAEAILSLLAGADSVLADRRLVIAVVGLVVILPLCFPRELGALSWVSAAAVRLPEAATWWGGESDRL